MVRTKASSAAWSGSRSQTRAEPACGIENHSDPLTSFARGRASSTKSFASPFDEPAGFLADDPVENTNAELGVAVENDITDVHPPPIAHDDEIAAMELRLHARSVDDRIARGSAELGGSEKEPGRSDQDHGDDRGGCSRSGDVAHEGVSRTSEEAPARLLSGRVLLDCDDRQLVGREDADVRREVAGDARSAGDGAVRISRARLDELRLYGRGRSAERERDGVNVRGAR